MKKILLFVLIFIFLLSSVPVFANENVTVLLDGKEIDCRDVNGNNVPPLLIDGTTYLPVRAIANALDFDVVWDDSSKSVFINGIPEKAEKSDDVNIYLARAAFIALDVNGNVVTPILKDGTTYLPVRAIGLAFGKTVNWDNETKTVILTTPAYVSAADEIDETKIYAFLNKANGKAISVTTQGLVLEDFNCYSYQGFKLLKSETEGYYNIQSISNEKNFDVNGNSKNAGAKIITYNAGNADNQKFKLEISDDGYIIYALSSLLPIEDSAGVIKQNEKRSSLVQRWELVEFTPVEKADATICYTITAGSFTLSDDGNESWILVPNSDGEYIITNKATNKSLDVANNSKVSGDAVITYTTSGDPNQRWTFEKTTDGTYLIKSVHSALYLTVSDGTLVQWDEDISAVQKWTLK